MKLIWIDDDVRTLEPQRRFLENRGYDVEQIRDVDTAWKRLESASGEPLCVILDIMMATGELLAEKPTNGGLRAGQEFLRLMAEKGMLPRIKVFVFTVIDDPLTRQLCDELEVKFHRKNVYAGSQIVDLVIQEFGEP